MARFLLLTVVVALPWLFGGTYAGALYGTSVVVTAALAMWLISLFTRSDRGFAIPLAAVPLLLAVALGLFQTMPMELSDLERFSPVASEIWGHVADIRADGEAGGALGTISLNPAGTRMDTSLLVLSGIVFLLGARFFADERAQRWMWMVLALNGAALALFGIVQQITWNGRLYWTVEPTQVLNAFGPYVNHNNAAGYLNVCLGGVLVLLAGRKQARSQTRHRERGSSGADVSAARPGSFLGMIAGAAIVAGVMCSLSRGAYVALGVGLLLTLLFGWRRIRLGMLPGWTPVVCGFAVVLLVGLSASETVEQRLASIFHQKLSPDSRLAHWSDVMHAVPDYQWLGSGLGTYRYVYRNYVTVPTEEWFYHAENQYLEAAVEGGVVGLSLMLLAIVGVLWAIRHQLHQDPVPEDGWLALAALFALVTQAVHAFFDFGLYLPANMLLLALVCGAAAGRASRFGHFAPSYRGVAVSGPESLGVAFAVVFALLAESAFPLHETRTADAVSRARRALQPEIDSAGTDVMFLDAAVARFAQAAAARPGDADAQRALGNAWEYVYRRRALDDLSAGLSPDEREKRHADLWSRTQTAWLRARHTELLEQSRTDLAEQLRSHPVVSETLPKAHEAYLQAIRNCPVLAASVLSVAELAFVTETARADACLPLLAAVGRGEPRLMYRGGLLAEELGKADEAFAFWHASLAKSDEHLTEIVERSLKHAPLSRVIEDVLPERPLPYIRLARGKFSGAPHAAEMTLLLEKAETLLADDDSGSAESHHVRGTLFAMKDDVTQAVRAYGEALRIKPRQAAWRYELAEVLKNAGRIDEAREQIRICLLLDPENARYRELYQQLLRHGVG